MTKLTTENIVDFMSSVSDAIKDKGFTESFNIVVTAKADEFEKIDEDIFYKLREDGSTEEFVPSDDEFSVLFDERLKLTVVKHQETKA